MRFATAALLCTVAAAQDLKHISVPTANSAQPIAVAAMEIERESEYPSVIHLKGAVEIKMPVCVRSGPGNTQTCAGEIILRAEEADLHEDTGQIETRRGATLTRK